MGDPVAIPWVSQRACGSAVEKERALIKEYKLLWHKKLTGLCHNILILPIPVQRWGEKYDKVGRGAPL